MCFFHTTVEEFKIATIIGHFGFVFWGKLVQRNRIVIVTGSFSKCSVFKIHTSQQSWRFEITPECFLKTPFLWRISVDGRSNGKNKVPGVFKYLQQNVVIGAKAMRWTPPDQKKSFLYTNFLNYYSNLPKCRISSTDQYNRPLSIY